MTERQGAIAVSFLTGRLTAQEEDLFRDAADGRWDEHTLLTAALVASGVEGDQAIRRYADRFEALAAELAAQIDQADPPRARAEKAFAFLHQRVLTAGYHLECTGVTWALDDGRFNCVSASVLFNCLASRLGLTAYGLEMPGHAMSRLILPDETLDIETTCPGWFRLADSPQPALPGGQLVAAGGRGGDAASRPPRQVSDVQLVAMIYYNRGVDLLNKKQFAEALAANAKAVRLDPESTSAGGNLRATLNNWAIDLGTTGRFAEAAALLRLGLQLDPDYPVFQANHVHVYLQWADALCRDGNYPLAIERLRAAAQEQPGQPFFEQAWRDVYRRWIQAQSPEAR